MVGIYLHVPFCASRCVYCGFYSTTEKDLRDRYVDALRDEMKMRPMTDEIATIYLGGGTPSQLSPSQLRRVFEGMREAYGEVNDDVEVTMECNPDDVTPSFARVLADLSINRVSMGAQTFDDDRLRFLRRRHRSEEVRQAVDNLRAVGIGNISVDLMFGFPGETLEDWETDLQRTMAIHLTHVSAYCLTYEEGTPLYKMRGTGRVKEVDEEVSVAMYGRLIDRLSAEGYEHYEISNFALPGYRSRHNSSYWHEIPYVGIGAAAHSYDLRGRSWNVADVRAYIDAIERGELPSKEETLDIVTRYNDLVTTALRTKEGIDLSHLRKDYGEEYYLYILSTAAPHLRHERMTITDDHLALTRKGLFVSDDIMSDLILA